MLTLEKIAERVRSTFCGQSVYFSLAELPSNIYVPSQWQNFGLGGREQARFPATWHSCASKFPNTFSLLQRCLLGTFVLSGERIELGYIFHDANDLYFYLGGMPLKDRPAEHSRISALSKDLFEFYLKVHDGFTFYPARSMGPQRSEDFTCVADFIDEEDTSFANNWLTIFSNGAGDYVAIDTSSRADNQGLIWWHDQPTEPELNVDIFEVMDTWMSIFLEDTLPSEDVFVQSPEA